MDFEKQMGTINILCLLFNFYRIPVDIRVRNRILLVSNMAGLSDANYFMSRYYTEGERNSLYQQAVELTNQLRLQAGGLDE